MIAIYHLVADAVAVAISAASEAGVRLGSPCRRINCSASSAAIVSALQKDSGFFD
jgi:hypothetical protein